MNLVFWTLLIAGILLVLWPVLVTMSTGAALTIWLLGALLLIAAFFVLPSRWPPRETLSPATVHVRRRRSPPAP